MARVSDGCETWQCLAARVKLRSEQTARKYLIWCISIRHVLWPGGPMARPSVANPLIKWM